MASLKFWWQTGLNSLELPLQHLQSLMIFHHVTSSPKYLQSNGEAEHAVRTVKGLLKKAVDPYPAYRATPLQNGYSPAQLLKGRRLRTSVPTLPALLDPALPDCEAVAQKEKENSMTDEQRCNLCHRAQVSTGWLLDRKCGLQIKMQLELWLVATLLHTHTSWMGLMVKTITISSQTGGTPKEQPLGDVPEQTSVEPPKPNIPAVPSIHRTRSGRVVVRPTYGLIS